jgi:processive 1,2-diacylglycerol beta-glucosyltransferase
MKVLILTAEYGSGHTIASKALQQALIEKNIVHNVLDVVEIGGIVEKASSKIYELMTKKGHLAWGMLYPNKITTGTSIRSLYRLLYKDKFAEYIEFSNPDVIVSTHFLTTVIGLMHKVKHPDTKVYSIITDFTVHPLWIWGGTEKYFVGSKDSKIEAVSSGAREEEVIVSGIPLRRDFWKLPRKSQVRKYLSLPEKDTIVLVSAGSYDSTPIEPILSYVAAKKNVYTIVLAGRKIEAYNKYNKLLREMNVRGTVFPFVDFVTSIMAASDIFITKAGGISVAEGLAAQLPMIFVKSMPGQEAGNVFIMEKEGCARSSDTAEDAVNHLDFLLQNTGELEKMKINSKKLAHPKASLDIISYIEKNN